MNFISSTMPDIDFCYNISTYKSTYVSISLVFQKDCSYGKNQFKKNDVIYINLLDLLALLQYPEIKTYDEEMMQQFYFDHLHFLKITIDEILELVVKYLKQEEFKKEF